MRYAALALVALVLAGCDRFGGESPAARQAADEAAIARVAASIDDAVDRKDWVAVRSYFSDRVEADFSTFGNTPGTVSADELVGNWKASLPEAKTSHHQTSNPIVTVTGDTAKLTAHCYVTQMLKFRPADNNLWEVWGVYDERFVRTKDGWKVTRYKFTKTNERGDPSIRTAKPD